MSGIPRPMLLAVVSVSIVFCGVVRLFLAFGRLPNPLRLPSPNGYDDLLAAGRVVVMNVDDLAKVDHEAFRSLVTTNLRRVAISRSAAARSMTPITASIASPLP